MSLVIDGDRSIKRLPAGKRLLALIKEIGVPAKAIIRDGFRIKAWQMDHLEKISIKAPAGAVVICSKPDGAKVAVADYWAGAFGAVSDLHVMFFDGYEIAAHDSTADELTEQGCRIIKFRPVQTIARYRNESGSLLTVNNRPSTQAITAYGAAEGYVLNISDGLYLDLDSDGGPPEYPYPFFESFVSPYMAAGKYLNKRRTCVAASMAYDVMHWGMTMDGGRKVMWGLHDIDPWEGFICARDIDLNFVAEDGSVAPNIKRILLSEVVPSGAGMPEELRALLLDWQKSVVTALGSYAAVADGELVFIHAAHFARNTYSADGTTGAATWSYFTANPGQRKWECFISVKRGDTVTLIDSSQFLPAMKAAAVKAWPTPGGESEMFRLAQMLMFILRWPNNYRYEQISWATVTPHDGAMFQGHDGLAYSWTRHYGGFSIGPDGIAVAALAMPLAVTGAEGVRPEITPCEDQVYVCVCNKVASGIAGISIGSPFGEWADLPLPDGSLKCVKILSASESKASFLGVVKKEAVTEEEEVIEPAKYNLCFLAMTKNEEGWEGAWQLLGVVPIEVGAPDGMGDTDALAVGLFGGDTGKDYPAVIHPPEAVVPYSSYLEHLP